MIFSKESKKMLSEDQTLIRLSKIFLKRQHNGISDNNKLGVRTLIAGRYKNCNDIWYQNTTLLFNS